MRPIERAAAALAMLLAGCASGTAAPRSAAPFELMRTLQALQAQIATGSTAALGGQPKLIEHLAERFLAADPQVWRTRKNAWAAASYLFSGGRPAVGRALIERNALPKEDLGLLKGALAYAAGRDGQAKDLLLPIDTSGLPALLRAHLALVQASLLSRDDPAAAIKLLDLARLLAPGTLIEEAALRREVFLAGDRKDVARFASLSRQYARRFRQSVYADNFRDRLRSTIKAIGRRGNSKQLPEIEALAAQLEPEDQRTIYLSVARSAVLQNKSDVAGFAAQRAAGLSHEGSADAARASLYLGASLLLTDKYADGVEKLAHVDRTRLAKRDSELYEAVTSVSKILRQPLAARSPADEPMAGGSPSSPGERTAQSSEVIEQATRAVADADALLKSASP